MSERALISYRQREGIALAKQRGTYRWRKSALVDDQVVELHRRTGAGEEKADSRASAALLARRWSRCSRLECARPGRHILRQTRPQRSHLLFTLYFPLMTTDTRRLTILSAEEISALYVASA